VTKAACENRGHVPGRLLTKRVTCWHSAAFGHSTRASCFLLGVLYSRKRWHKRSEVLNQLSLLPFHANQVYISLHAIQPVEVLQPHTHAM
jgi:hypothetical protein